MFLLFPAERNGQLVFYADGHFSGTEIGQRATIQALVNAGYTVAAFSMPQFGRNNQPVVVLDNIGPVKFFSHHQLILLDR